LDEETEQIDKALTSLAAFDLLPQKTKVDTVSPLASSIIGRNPKESIAWGKSEIIVRATLEQVLAFVWQIDSRARRKSNDLEKTMIEVNSLHHNIAYFCKKGNRGGFVKISPRDGLSSFVWQRQDNDTIIISGAPTDHKDKPVVSGRVRGKFPFTVKLERQFDKCKLTYCFSWDMNGLIPHVIIDHYTKQGLQLTEFVQQYFQQLRPLDKLDEQDGVAMAEAFLLKYSKKDKHEI